MSSTCYQRNTMPTNDGHEVYYELNGNPSGIPVLVLHGGPGAGLASNYTALFDLDTYHVIGFDQRGCGRSTPFLSTTANTTAHLLSDITRLRQLLGIEQWLLFGGSWGTTLALLAAINEPETVTGMILRGVFLARRSDFEWFLAPEGGAAQVYPDAYQQFVAGIPQVTDLTSVLTYYGNAFNSIDVTQRHEAASRWYRWEEATARVHPITTDSGQLNGHRGVLSLALFEWHYVANQCFIAENYILQHACNISHIPGKIIHGRCDSVCKPEGAFALHQHWQNSELQFIAGAGHSSTEQGIRMALRDAINDFKSTLQ
ncbi:prolyl aminopeptidase [Alteromonas gilva]|uniref:Proline iminopeptidase n=1 Tax=Alteromonas gilva TaxID=2987522 RepID=A0ABT5L5S3_9ALTE|nr:prolyl aminopeptidase [Alteromonas gilva]MDC8832410.1 prolyl aminopeptidase [Alteromonas gilva]